MIKKQVTFEYVGSSENQNNNNNKLNLSKNLKHHKLYDCEKN